MVRNRLELLKELEELSEAIETARTLLEQASNSYDRIYSFVEDMPEVE